MLITIKFKPDLEDHSIIYELVELTEEGFRDVIENNPLKLLELLEQIKKSYEYGSIYINKNQSKHGKFN